MVGSNAPGCAGRTYQPAARAAVTLLEWTGVSVYVELVSVYDWEAGSVSVTRAGSVIWGSTMLAPRARFSLLSLVGSGVSVDDPTAFVPECDVWCPATN